MKKLLIIFFVLAFVSCAKICYVPQCNEVNVIVKVQNYQTEKNVDFNELLYEWDENVYGKIVENNVDTLSCVVFNAIMSVENIIELDRINEKNISVAYPNTYNLLFHNKTKDTHYFVSDGKYISSAGYKYSFPDFNFSETLGIINESEEQYVAYEPDVLSVINPSDLTYENLEKCEDGTYKYEYNIYSNLEPVSFVYIIQIVVYDDDKTIPFIIGNCNYIGICGVSENVEMISKENGIKRGVIEAEDIKPFQYHNDCAVCCTKIITYGMPSNSSSSWGENKRCELGLEIALTDGKRKRGKLQIAQKLEDKPNGGVITVVLNNSDVYNSTDYIVDSVEPIVENWEENVFDIPF